LEKWIEAMKFEMDSMYTNQVWNLVEVPEGINFKNKTYMGGKVNAYLQSTSGCLA